MGKLFKQLYTLQGHQHWVNSVDVAPNGAEVVSCSWDKTVRLWWRTVGENLRKKDVIDNRNTNKNNDNNNDNDNNNNNGTWNGMKFNGHSARVRTCCFNHDGLLIASGSTDETVRIWNRDTCTDFIILKHKGEVEACCFSTYCPAQLASGGEEPNVYVWDIETKQQIHSLKAHSKRITCCKYFPRVSSGNVLVTGSLDGTIRNWDITSGKEIRSIKCSGGIRCCDVSPDEQLIATGSHDASLKIWDMRTGQTLKTVEFEGYVFSCAFSPQSDYIVAGIGNPDYLAHAISLHDDSCHHVLLGNVDHVSSVSWRENTIAVGTSFHNVTIFTCEGD